MDIAKINADLDEIERRVDSIRAEVDSTEPLPADEVLTTDELITKLGTGGEIYLGEKILFENTDSFYVDSNTTLHGNRSKFNTDKESIRVGPGQVNSKISQLFLESRDPSSVVELGSSNAQLQNTIEQVPSDWKLTNLKIDYFRGKCGLEINGSSVLIKDCGVLDVYDGSSQNRDSQAVLLDNSPGYLTIEGGKFEAASQNFQSGGSNIKIGTVRKNIRIKDAVFTKRMSWKGVVTTVKCLVNLEDATDVIIENTMFENCWAAAGNGECFMFTPTRGGQVRDVFVTNCNVSNVGSICVITGVDSSEVNTNRTTVTFNGGVFKTNKTQLGGRGIFALMDRGPESLQVTGCDIEIDGNNFIELAGTARMDMLRVTNSRWNYGQNGIRIGGLNHGDNSKGMITMIEIKGNTIVAAHKDFKARYPENIYV